MITSDRIEGIMVGTGTAMTVAATYLVTTEIPAEIKLPVSGVLGTIGVALLAFWKREVNVPAKTA